MLQSGQDLHSQISDDETGAMDLKTVIDMSRIPHEESTVTSNMANFPTTHPTDSDEQAKTNGQEDDSISDYKPSPSDSSDDTDVPATKTRKYIAGSDSYGNIHPAVWRILHGDYSVADTPEGDTVVYGQFPFILGIQLFYGSRLKLYDLILVILDKKDALS